MVGFNSLGEGSIPNPFRNRSLGFFPEKNVRKHVPKDFHMYSVAVHGRSQAVDEDSLLLPFFGALAARRLWLG